jgi:rhamnose utilization protein RhaD (predicted bifunctional aldolase and dehydrogenase)
MAAEGSDYVPVSDPFVHELAIDALQCAMAAKGSLYPDHVIFLGPSVLLLQDSDNVKGTLAAQARPIAPLVLVPGAGALLPRAATASARALARCLADVVARQRPGDPLRYLTATDEQALLNWDAEKYRQALARTSP